MLANSHEEYSLVDFRTILGNLLNEDVLNELDLVVRNVNLISRPELRNFCESAFLLFLHHKLHLFFGVFKVEFIPSLVLIQVFAFVIDGASLFIALIAFTVIVEVGLEFSEGDELSVADVVVTLFETLPLKLLVLLNF
jgi:hypothetical protein